MCLVSPSRALSQDIGRWLSSVFDWCWLPSKSSIQVMLEAYKSTAGEEAATEATIKKALWSSLTRLTTKSRMICMHAEIVANPTRGYKNIISLSMCHIKMEHNRSRFERKAMLCILMNRTQYFKPNCNASLDIVFILAILSNTHQKKETKKNKKHNPQFARTRDSSCVDPKDP